MHINIDMYPIYTTLNQLEAFHFQFKLNFFCYITSLCLFLQIVDLHRDYNIIKIIHEIIGSVLQEEKSFLPFSEQVQSLKFLHRSIKQLLCELHTFLLVLGFHDVIHGFVGDVINSPDWCVFESVSTRYERDVYLLRQVTAVSSEIYHRYSMLIP